MYVYFQRPDEQHPQRLYLVTRHFSPQSRRFQPSPLQRIEPLLKVPVEHDHFLQRLHGVALVKGDELVGRRLQRGLLAAVEPDDAVHFPHS